MFSWFSRARRNSPSVSCRAARPRLESLETRDCPAAATITSLQATLMGNQTVLVTGTVQDESPQTVLINLGGTITPHTVSVASNGTFSWTTTATATTSGDVTAVAVDNEGLASMVAIAPFVNLPPQIVNFTATITAGNTWLLSGKVLDEAPANLRVNLTGSPLINNAQVFTAADGTFSFTVDVPAGTSFTATADTTDAWGLASLPVDALVGTV